MLRDPRVIAIPKAGDLAHVRANRRVLSAEELAEIDVDFQPPARRTRLAML